MRELIAKWLPLFFEPDDVFEVRALDVERPGQKSGGFISLARLPTMLGVIKALADKASGVYFTPQRLNPAVLERSPNLLTRLNEVNGEIRPRLTHDEDVTERRFLIIDVDPTKPQEFKKYSATDAEKELALDLANRVKSELMKEGCGAPLVVDSGNGYHLYFRLRVPQVGGRVQSATDPIAQLLRVLKEKFDTPGASIDPSVFNASRIMKVPGTVGRKGPYSSDRPHRTSEVIEVPSDW